MSAPNEQPEQKEVDLFPFFVWISRGFGNLGRSIKNGVKGFFHFIVLTLVFMKKNVILLGVLFVGGAAWGIYLDQQVKKTFTAEMRVEPNFDSASQLISNINYFESLVYRNDPASLAKELGITTAQAEGLHNFAIVPDYNDTELLIEYDELSRNADSVAVSNMDFEAYKSSKRAYDYQYLTINISGNDRAVVEASAAQAVKVEETPGIKAKRLSEQENISFNIRSLEQQINAIDSLQVAYQKAISTSSTNNTSQGANNFYMGNQRPSEALKSLFTEKPRVLEQLEELKEKKYKNSQVVSVISTYVNKGSIEVKHYKFKLAFALLGLGMLIALIPLLWKYLNKVEKDL